MQVYTMMMTSCRHCMTVAVPALVRRMASRYENEFPNTPNAVNTAMVARWRGFLSNWTNRARSNRTITTMNIAPASSWRMLSNQMVSIW